MISLLTDATKALAILDTLSSYIPNMNLFVPMYVRKEALLSSQIEGTQATLEDVLDPLIEKNAKEIFDYLEKNPIIDIKKTSEELSLAFSTVSASVKRLEECGILVQTNNANRNRVFAYEDYLGILRKDT